MFARLAPNPFPTFVLSFHRLALKGPTFPFPFLFPLALLRIKFVAFGSVSVSLSSFPPSIYQTDLARLSGHVNSKMGKQGIGLRMQKNIMGKMGAKTVKAIIDEETSAMLDDVHDLWQLQTDEKTADKLLKNLIKIVVKLVLLLKNKQFNTDEIAMVAKAQNEFKKISMTIISFYEVIGSFDTEFLNNEFKDLHTCLETLLKPHLTEKSVGRLANVFGHLMKPGLMQKSFDPKNEKEYELVGSICAQLKKMVHENKF